MDEMSADVAAETAGARVAARLSSDYVLRSLLLLAGRYDGELMTGVVSLAIIAANTAHLEQAAGTPQYPDLGEIPPDDLRKPISVLALAGSLGLPFETTRRHVNRLRKAGRCVRVKGGVIVPAESLRNFDNDAALVANLTNLRRLFRSLAKAGLDLG